MNSKSILRLMRTPTPGYGSRVERFWSQVYVHRVAAALQGLEFSGTDQVHHDETCPKTCVRHLAVMTPKDHGRLHIGLRQIPR